MIRECINKSKTQDLLEKIVSDYGVEILNEENHSRLNKALTSLDNSTEKDWLLIANMKRIPQKLHAIMNLSQNEKQKVIEECIDALTALTLNENLCETIVSQYMKILNINVNLNKKVEVEKKLGLFNYAEHVYKTCQIGDKIWFAENFNFLKNPILIKNRTNNKKLKDTFSIALESIAFGINYGEIIGKETENKKYGRLYTWKEANACIPQNWRLPTIDDYKSMVAYINSLRYDAGTVLKAKNEWYGDADQGLDLFGFCAYPTAKDPETGESQTCFWASSKNGDKSNSHYCVCLSANSNKFILRDNVRDNYYACVRYVKDVD